MNYEDFVDTELFYELRNISYIPENGSVYGTVIYGFVYGSARYSPGDRVIYYLNSGNMYQCNTRV